ncbi:hypothetical protein [Nocardia sp. NPDC006630]|uniref:hypothetical protein n=1 Tax=Nocardia sp. NPDC006630 TaxID=3157181 RepID=UPI00339FD383
MQGMTDQQFHAALTGLAADFGAWDRAAVVTACTTAGWTVDDDDEIADIPGAERGGWMSDNDHRTDPGAPEYDAVGMYVGHAEPDQFPTYLAAAIEVWGEPSMFGGSRNVFVRWRDKVTFRELSMDHSGELNLRAASTEVFEEWDYRAWDFEDDLTEVPFTWMGDKDGPGMDGFAMGEKVVSNWDDVAEALKNTLLDVQLGMWALGTADPDPELGPDRLVITLQADTDLDEEDEQDDEDRDASTVDSDLKVQIVLYPDTLLLLVSDGDDWQDELTAKGFKPYGDGVQARDYTADPTAITEAAQLTAIFLRHFGFESPGEVTHDSWRHPSPYSYFTLTCVGVPESS